MLTKRGKYALRAVLYLARHKDKNLTLIQEIARKEVIPKKFLEAILLDLRNENILTSKIGKGGGYQLARQPSEIMLGEIIRAIDGPLAPIPCASQTAYMPCSDCPDVNNCMIRAIMRDVRDAMSTILDGTSLQTLLDRSASMEASQSGLMTFEI